ncbi:hypothetical protein [Sporichthya polymorpha]|uniref:hypothetical protein n=1 Tax=Sporichthya polymorpha TaxID=35751 RepID=UPI000367A07C|nr:hypothetical protein [Sporichthya polymorpha]
MSGGQGTVAAAAFVWLGMVLAISFLEAPLKFRAPGVDLRLGLGIGRIVFKALNLVELVLAVLIAGALAFGDTADGLLTAACVPIGVLIAQLLLVRPALTKRSNRVLAGEDAGGSRVHLIYVAAEVVKVAALVVLGVAALRG